MKARQFNVNDFRVASPCSVGWDSMSGDERSRICEVCEMKVHNIAGLDAAEVENLIADRGGRLCIRLFRRTDGTVMTKDCPVGLRSIRKRTMRFASAAAAALLGLFSISYGQKNDKRVSPATSVTEKVQDDRIVLSGTVTDPHGAVVPGAKVSLFKENAKRSLRTVRSDDAGKFAFSDISDADYSIQIESAGFKKYVMVKVTIRNPLRIVLAVGLEPDGAEEIVGIYVDLDLDEVSTSSKVNTIDTIDLIRRLPGRRP
ncbi:MAG: carboxypeptidase regulatory-like domain-containing protein [Acidobacteria bacterium]|nr:carboxypeptidase regulatory-like domain-containing protein [Acidobacteriota bacterium]